MLGVINKTSNSSSKKAIFFKGGYLNPDVLRSHSIERFDPDFLVVLTEESASDANWFNAAVNRSTDNWANALPPGPPVSSSLEPK